MELLCPNCQQKLTVPDNFAGQPMQCPQCKGAFTVPSLAPAPAPAYVPPPEKAVPSPLRLDDAGVLPGGPSPAPPAPAAARPEPAVSPAPAAPQRVPVSHDYRHRWSIWFSARVLPWVVVGLLSVVLVLTFFPWVGYYPGGVHVVSQSAWQAAFGGHSAVDPELEKLSPLAKDSRWHVQPHASALLVLFLLFLILALLFAGVAAAMDVITTGLPPWLERLRPWRWALVYAAALLTFLLFVVQVLAGFNLLNAARERGNNILAEEVKNAPTPADKKAKEIEVRTDLVSFRYTGWMRLAFWLMFVTAASTTLTYLQARRPGLPTPRIDLLW
jgi:hypothetical protein